MQNAIAFCDNDVVVVAWSYGMKLAGCMGFAVYRIDAAGAETALPSLAVFPGFVAKPGQTTAHGSLLSGATARFEESSAVDAVRKRIGELYP